MGRGTVRAGAPTTGIQAAAGTDNSLTDPRIILFDPPVRPCIINNLTTSGNDIRVKVNTETNGTVSNDFDADADDDGGGHFSIATATSATAREVPFVDVSLGGQIAVHSVSIATLDAADDLDVVSVVGWEP